MNFNSSCEIPKKTNTENVVKYNKLDPIIIIFKKIVFGFFFIKIFKINPLNSIQEITEIKINEIIKINE